MASLKPTVELGVELAGRFGGYTNIARDVLMEPGIRISRGIRGGRPTDRVSSTGTLSFRLNNSAKNSASTLGYYSLFHASKRSGWALGIAGYLKLTDTNTSTQYTVFQGRIDSVVPVAGKNGERYVDVTMVDWFDELARWKLTPEIGEQVNQRWDQIIQDIYDNMPTRHPVITNLFTAGVESYPFALDTSEQGTQTALGEFQKLAMSEVGLVYISYSSVSGTQFNAEGRHQRVLTTTSAWTIGDSDISQLTMASSRDDIVNTIRVQIHPKTADTSATTLIYRQVNPIPMANGDTQILMGPYRDVNGTVLTASDQIGAFDVRTTDAVFTANTLADGTGTDLTSGFSVVVAAGASGARFTVTNSSGSSGFLTLLNLYGKGIYSLDTMQFQATDATSITTNGERAVVFDMPYQNDPDTAQGAADYFLAKYKDPSAFVQTVTVFARSTTALDKILNLDISNRLTITETVTGANAHFFINGVDVTVTPSGHLVASYVLAPATDPLSGLYWILDTSTLGTDTVLSPF